MKKDDRIRFTLRIPNNLFNLVQEKAIQTGVSTNALILQILWEWVNRYDLKEKEEKKRLHKVLGNHLA